MEAQVLLDKEKAIHKERIQMSLGRKRTTQYVTEFGEATEFLLRQKMETNSIKIYLKQKETELKELLQGKEELNKSLQAFKQAREIEIKDLLEKLAKAEEKQMERNEEVALLRDKLVQSSNEQHQKQAQIIALETERDNIIMENRKMIVEQDRKLRKKFEVSCWE